MRRVKINSYDYKFTASQKECQLLIATALSDHADLPTNFVTPTSKVRGFPDEKLTVSALGGVTARYV